MRTKAQLTPVGNPRRPLNSPNLVYIFVKNKFYSSRTNFFTQPQKRRLTIALASDIRPAGRSVSTDRRNKMIKPTPGRIVWYNPKPQDNLEDGPVNAEPQPMAAMVLYVHGIAKVNLMVFSPYGQTRFMRDVLLWQGEEVGDRPKWGYAEWMPYQRGQQAKTEQLEQQLAAQQSNTQAASNSLPPC